MALARCPARMDWKIELVAIPVTDAALATAPPRIAPGTLPQIPGHGRSWQPHERAKVGLFSGGYYKLPLIFNIAMTALDEHVMGAWQEGGAMSADGRRTARRRRGLPNWRIVRYADDFAVLVNGTEQDAAALREDIADVLATMGLQLWESKTRVAHMSEGFSFLGFRIQWRQKRGTSKHYVYTFIDDRPIRSLKAKIRALTHRTSQLDLEWVLTRLNQVMHGWAGYFRHAVAKNAFAMLDNFAWRRVIHMLMERHRWRWKDVRRRFTTPSGRWLPVTAGDAELRHIAAIPVARYRYRGTQIPSPWALNQPDGGNRGEPVALKGARRVRREVRGDGPGAIPVPRPGPTQRHDRGWLTERRLPSLRGCHRAG